MTSQFFPRPHSSHTRWVARFASVAAIGAWFAPLAMVAIGDRARARGIERHADCRLVDADSRPELRLIREDPSIESASVDRVYAGERVQLAANWRSIGGPFGYNWVEVVEPAEGYIANSHIDATSSTLRHCDYSYSQSRVPRPTAAGFFSGEGSAEPRFTEFYNYCQEVVQPEGLTIRARPSETSARVDGVEDGRLVMLAQDTPPVIDEDGRYWLAIDEPEFGYISGGFSENFENIEPCRDYDFRR